MTGLQGPIAATIPFSVGQNSSPFSTDALGQPFIISFAGFGSNYQYPIILEEGVWASGIIPFQASTPFAPSFVVPHDGTVRSIYALFSSKSTIMFPASSIVRPFVCLAICNTTDLVYTILPSTMTFVEPYIGGIEYAKHTLRRGDLTGLNVALTAGTLVGIVLGIMADNVTEELSAGLAASGGIFIE